VSAFRIAISGDFFTAAGEPVFPHFDLSRLDREPDVEYAMIGRGPVLKAEELEGFDALILLAPQFRAQSVPADGRLTVIARGGVGYDTVDVAACTDNGVALVITPDAVRRPVAVMVITFMTALAGQLFALDRVTRKADWSARLNHGGVGFIGKKFGQIGIGNIGAEVARLAKPFGLEVIANDPYVDPDVAAELGVTLVDKDTIFSQSDFLSVSCPLNDETRGLVNAERLAQMKPSAYLINTSRGPVVDQAALTEALANGRIAGAGLDVLEKEPPDPDDPLLSMDNVILSPHSQCWTDQMFQTMAECDIAACLDVMRGRNPINVVNGEVLERNRFIAKLDAYREAFGG
jgi:phosphoglycerate dehydrogenase-like enzyme